MGKRRDAQRKREDARTWLRRNGYPEVARQIDAIEAQWRADGKRTRRNWWEVLAGDKDGRPREVAGRKFLVIQEAVKRQNAMSTSGTVRTEEQDRPKKVSAVSHASSRKESREPRPEQKPVPAIKASSPSPRPKRPRAQSGIGGSAPAHKDQALRETSRRPDTNRQVFVAYSYKDYPKADYRRVFTELEREYSIRFIFADERITNMHIMQKIISYIRSSDFSVFDISGWNPNVTLELGFAMAVGDNWYICLNPEKTPLPEVPSDLKGLDRIQYTTFSELGTQLRALVEQRYPKRSSDLEEFLKTKREQARDLLQLQGGLRMSDIAELLGVAVPVAQMIMQPLIESLETTGTRRHMRYYLRGTAPSRSS